MIKITYLKRKIKVTLQRIYRWFKSGVWSDPQNKTQHDRLILKVLRLFLANPEVRLFYSPLSSKVYAHTADKKIIVIFDEYTLNITDHKVFFTTYLKRGIGPEIMEYAKERIHNDMSIIEKAILVNENVFLSSLYDKFSNKPPTEESK